MMTPRPNPPRFGKPAGLAVLAGAVVLLAPQAASAYVGPGAGLTAIGGVLALIAAVLLAVVGFVWYPIKRLLRGRRAAGSGASEAEPSARVDPTVSDPTVSDPAVSDPALSDPAIARGPTMGDPRPAAPLRSERVEAREP